MTYETEMNTENSMNDNSRCGYVAILGAPNAGKSTLVNHMVGAKVTIVSPKVQTTRNRILGIFIEDQTQIILMDTPGLFKPKTRLDRAMVGAAWNGANEADIICYLFDAKNNLSDADKDHIERLKTHHANRPVYLLLNKIDAIDPPRLLTLAQDFHALFAFTETFMISALKGKGIDDFKQKLAVHLPHGPHLFSDDQMTDMPLRLLAAEITREQIFYQLQNELPYSITVETESWETQKNGVTKIRQVIHVERDSQKGIVVGKAGQRLKDIGSKSRSQLEYMIDGKVYLELFVRVSEKWRDDPVYYETWGLEQS
jgi:GTPase